MAVYVLGENSTPTYSDQSVDFTFDGERDVALQLLTPDANASAETQLQLGNGLDEEYRALLRFHDVKKLPANENIVAAYLELTPGAGFGDAIAEIRQCNRRWGLNVATWNSYNHAGAQTWETSGALGATDAGAVLDTVTVNNSSPSRVRWDVTGAVVAWQGGAPNNGLIISCQNYQADNAFRFFERWNSLTDGVRPELIVITDGAGGGTTVEETILLEDPPITFTGTDGDPAPAPLAALTGTFEIFSNQLRMTGSVPVGTIGSKIGADTETADGRISGTYNPAGSGGDDTGLMIRYVDADNFWDCINASGTLNLVLISNNSIAYSTPYVIPGYDANTPFDVEIDFTADLIRVYLNGSATPVISVTDGVHFNATTHGMKYAGASALMDDLSLPSLAPVPGITAVSGTFAPGQTIDIDFENFGGPITSVLFRDAALTINSQDADTVNVTIPLTIDEPWGSTGTLLISDGTFSGILTLQTLSHPAGYHPVVIYDGTELIYTGEGQSESFKEMAENDYPQPANGGHTGFELEAGDELRITAATNMTVGNNTVPVINPSGNVSGTFHVYRDSSGEVFPVLTYRWEIPDSVPDAFTIPAETGAEVGSLVTSQAVTPPGFNQATSISVGGGAQISVAGGAFAASGTINAGESFVVQALASSDYTTVTEFTVTIGGVDAVFSITTEFAPGSFLLGNVFTIPYDPRKREKGLIVFDNNTMEIRLLGLTLGPDKTPINDAVVTARFTDMEGVPVVGLTDPVAMENFTTAGDYRAELSHAAEFVVSTKYECTVVAVAGATRAEWVEEVAVERRDIQDESRFVLSPE